MNFTATCRALIRRTIPVLASLLMVVSGPGACGDESDPAVMPSQPVGAALTSSAELTVQDDGDEKARSEIPAFLHLALWDRIKEGMTEKQVREILGEPGQILDGGFMVQWFYQVSWSGTEIPVGTIVFQNDVVAQTASPPVEVLDQLGIKYAAKQKTDAQPDSGSGEKQKAKQNTQTQAAQKQPTEAAEAERLAESPADGKPGWLHKERWDLLNRGQTPEQILAILGEPHHVSSDPESGDDLLWYYGIPNAEIKVSFRKREDGLHASNINQQYGMSISGAEDTRDGLLEAWGCSDLGWPRWMDPQHWVGVRARMSPAAVEQRLGQPTYRWRNGMLWIYSYVWPCGRGDARVEFEDPEFPELDRYDVPNFKWGNNLRRLLASQEALKVPQWAHETSWFAYDCMVQAALARGYGRNAKPSAVRASTTGLGEPDETAWESRPGRFGDTWHRVWRYGDGRLVWKTTVPSSADPESIIADEGVLVEVTSPSMRQMVEHAVAEDAPTAWRELALRSGWRPAEDRLLPLQADRLQPVDVGQLYEQLGEPKRLSNQRWILSQPIAAGLGSPADGMIFVGLSLEYRWEDKKSAAVSLTCEVPRAWGGRVIETATRQDLADKRAWLFRMMPPEETKRPGWTHPQRWEQLDEIREKIQQHGVEVPAEGLRQLHADFGYADQETWEKRQDTAGIDYWTMVWRYADGRIVWRTVERATDDDPPQGYDPTEGSLLEFTPPSRAAIEAAGCDRTWAIEDPEYMVAGMEGRPIWFQWDRWNHFIENRDGSTWIRAILGEPTSRDVRDDGDVIWRYGPWQGEGERWNSGWVRFDRFGRVQGHELPQRKD